MRPPTLKEVHMRADIYIIHKPTDTPGDNSTAMVTRELDTKGERWHPLNLAEVDPFRCGIEQAVIWVCGMEQDNHQFEVLQALATRNRVINTPEAIATCASKVLTTALLVREKIRTPETFFSAIQRRCCGVHRVTGEGGLQAGVRVRRQRGQADQQRGPARRRAVLPAGVRPQRPGLPGLRHRGQGRRRDRAAARTT